MELRNHDFLLSADKSLANGEIKAYSEPCVWSRRKLGGGGRASRKGGFHRPTSLRISANTRNGFLA